MYGSPTGHWEICCTIWGSRKELQRLHYPEIMISLGVTCNSVTFTMEITLERLCEITDLVQSWLKNYRQI